MSTTKKKEKEAVEEGERHETKHGIYEYPPKTEQQTEKEIMK